MSCCQSQLHQSKLEIQQLFCENVLNQSITIQEMQTKLQSIIQIQNTKQQTQNEIILNSFVKLANLSIKRSVKLNIAKDLSSLISKTVKNVNQQILKVFQTNKNENNYFKFVTPSAQIKQSTNQKPNLNLNQTETNGVETQTQLITKRNFNEFKLEYVNKLKTKQQNQTENLKYKLTKFAGQEKQKKTLKESQNNELELLEQLIEKLITIIYILGRYKKWYDLQLLTIYSFYSINSISRQTDDYSLSFQPGTQIYVEYVYNIIQTINRYLFTQRIN
ncbi:Hypothetical_protein [Hexamita inflata]|uniref:Hypothetical_protein n=1 Tax=Hexamita inflata TaxID=28002 RepID=A0AA86TXK5_9EUKA|nr:Hypothetical protein HINF_LOCUS20925 [Hexamita inflata]